MAAPHAQGAISCGQAVSMISPCVNYARGQGTLPPGCCSGVKALNSAARSTPDRQQACACLKAAVGKISGLIQARAAGIPGACGLASLTPLAPPSTALL
ncbi:LOW QUALITY PROTEIN: non-specific lipid-transfer protein-like [Asparagus officinalis]|uniref:LOW QUALITY PROTEIN: non-specific lipid-transfer protein-like n=1 Tax=Asparagus officinalis TaxID=4686 RepID=UPI00098E6270|nr:LOW QUALITY PROTEIN: non-specific lipid-transfer protein-like [Asparagus officinalis]